MTTATGEGENVGDVDGGGDGDGMTTATGRATAMAMLTATGEGENVGEVDGGGDGDGMTTATVRAMAMAMFKATGEGLVGNSAGTAPLTGGSGIRISASDSGIPEICVGKTRANLWREGNYCLLYTSPSPRDLSTSRMPSSA